MTPQERAELVKQLGKEWTDKGKLIEGGFQAMRIMAIPPDASEAQVADMRMAYFSGAQHLFATMLNILDPGDEPTDADLKRMDLISDELDQFIKETLRFIKRPT